MKKTKKIINITITLLLILCLIFTISPTTPAKYGDKFKEFFAANLVIGVDFNKTAAYEPLLPVDRVKQIEVYVSTDLSGLYVDDMWYIEEINTNAYENQSIFGNIKVNNTPSWCTATVFPNLNVPLNIKKDGFSREVTLVIAVDEDAPAFSQEEIELEITVGNIGSIVGGTYTRKIQFIAGYLPLLDFNIPEKTKSISPGEIADFQMNVENLGNAKTLLNIDVLDKPEGWTIGVPDKVEINDSSTIILNVQGPISFGYHDEKESIRLKMVPAHFENTSVTGEEYIVSFIIQSRGFSTPGFGILGLFLAFTIVFICSKKNRITKSKKNGGRKT